MTFSSINMTLQFDGVLHVCSCTTALASVGRSSKSIAVCETSGTFYFFSAQHLRDEKYHDRAEKAAACQ
jgi:hypothetical protein